MTSARRSLFAPLRAAITAPSPSKRPRLSYSTSCPSCSHTVNKISSNCPSCSTLLAPPNRQSANGYSHFSLFDLPRKFSLNQSAVKRKFLEWQSKVHPDRVHGDWAIEWSGLVNEAYKTLTNPRTRAEYLLNLNGVRIDEDDSVDDPAFLMEIMEIREELEDAQSEEQVASIRQSNQENRDHAVLQLQAALDSHPPNLDEAKKLVITLRYYDNVEDVCREWQPGAENRRQVCIFDEQGRPAPAK